MSMTSPADSINDCVIVIFGASGDLTRRKLVPSLYNLYKQGLLPGRFAILGVSRSPLTEDAFRNSMVAWLDEPASHGANEQKARSGSAPQQHDFLALLHYLSIDTGNLSDYAKVGERLEELNVSHNCIFYLSTPPSLYEVIPGNLARHGLNDQSQGWKRIVVEKPFGSNLGSAQILNRQLLRDYTEDQIYRIDHYLGKETVQNLLVFRFSNMIFEPLWDAHHVDSVQITSAESIGIDQRGSYYEKSGAIKDMIQNHLLQVLGIVAMEPPVNIDAKSIRDETLKVFNSIRPFSSEDMGHNIVLGQYMPSSVDSAPITGYRQEEGVDPKSRTETFAAMRFYIDNWRWQNVPFYVRTGKRMPTRVSEVVINFKRTPHPFFFKEVIDTTPNQLIIRIQPNEGILLKFRMKKPGGGFETKTVNMDFHYASLSETYIPSAYERLLMDVMLGDSTLYARNDAVEACWQLVDPVLAWRDSGDAPVYGYPAGTWGPHNSDELLTRLNHEWRQPCKNLANDGEYCEL